ncbi:hypothetical protein BJF85_03350 [Saccharomonospora sp. CUA-673]|uniref:hypothetical protein n=1 Tax=Saccharomonospora sp. CUA-673 TaxID=1904969 RepID=UPI00095DA194|nr:hypothetical protein [Saccharomonospora sp. CUA-673]OLT43114.1 hypothetical protein BJF85_03350 [Saccharomonospora sp. CUA-673]
MRARRVTGAAMSVVVTAAILLTGAGSSAFEPVEPGAAHPSTATAHEAPDDDRQHPHRDQADGPHRVEIHVAGPEDTLMRVVRDRQGSEVALQGEPFDHAFTEPAGSDGYLGIQVAAASKQAGHPAVSCSITVNGVVVSEQESVRADHTGLAQVLCTVPRDV